MDGLAQREKNLILAPVAPDGRFSTKTKTNRIPAPVAPDGRFSTKTKKNNLILAPVAPDGRFSTVAPKKICFFFVVQFF